VKSSCQQRECVSYQRRQSIKAILKLHGNTYIMNRCFSSEVNARYSRAPISSDSRNLRACASPLPSSIVMFRKCITPLISAGISSRAGAQTHRQRMRRQAYVRRLLLNHYQVGVDVVVALPLTHLQPVSAPPGRNCIEHLLDKLGGVFCWLGW